DPLAAPNPCVVLKQLVEGQWSEVGRTETMHGSLNPVFSHVFLLDYFFEEMQAFCFEAYSASAEDGGVEEDTFLGAAEWSLGQITITLPLTLGTWGIPLITMTLPLIPGTWGIPLITMTLPLTPEMDVGYTPDNHDPTPNPGDGDEGSGAQWGRRQQVVNNNLSPTWEPFRVSLHSLCSCDPDKTICVVYDYNTSGKHDYIGEFTTTFREMQEVSSGKESSWDVVSVRYPPTSLHLSGNGVVPCSVEKVHTFLDYIMGGLQIYFSVAIDFTASNGDPRSEHSLHFINPKEPNEYLKALSAVGEICQDYDSDKKFPAFGFGARIPPNNEVSHDFAINFDPDNPECELSEGLIEAYKRCLPQIQLYGPTNLAPIIKRVLAPVSEEEDTGQ
uniref:C2 domain-containing protein n=1 Tax=Pelodiscus sinensis TaxID=13735 RepID=K7F937_PELSI